MGLDHIFLTVTPGAEEEAESLISLGLREGSSNRHPGQGTADRRFLFDNAFLELLYLVDRAEARSEITEPTGLYDRLASSAEGVSPVGICFRPSHHTESTAPFAAWHYRPRYLPSSLSVEIAQAPLEEPMWFYLGFARRPDLRAGENHEPRDHPLGVRRISRVRVTIPGGRPLSGAALAAAACPEMDVVRGDHHILELQLDEGRQGAVRDYRPLMPLVLSW